MPTPDPDQTTRSPSRAHYSSPPPVKLARDPSPSTSSLATAADALDARDAKPVNVKVEPDEGDGGGGMAVTDPGSRSIERGPQTETHSVQSSQSQASPTQPPSGAPFQSLSHTSTPPAPRPHLQLQLDSHSHSSVSPPAHEPTFTPAARTTTAREDARTHDSDSSRAPTPSGATASTAASPEHKVAKDKGKLHKQAAAGSKKRKDTKDHKDSKDSRDSKPKKRSEKHDTEREHKDKKRSKNKHDKTPEDAEEENDDDAHCICKGGNQEDDTFIGCEICESWFHPTCMGINEESVEMLDVYVCPPCEASTGRTTVYKRLCKREGCEKTARSTSKYCSSRCAFQSAQSVLATVEKKDLNVLETSLAGYPSPSPPATVEVHVSAAENGSRDQDGTASLVATLQAQKEDVVRLAELVSMRQALFAQAVAQWDALQPIASKDPVPAPKRKSKTKRREGETIVERPCGWDSRLMWTDEEVRAWYATTPHADGDGDVEMANDHEGGEQGTLLPTMCPAGRRCERHQGWQKTLGVALDVEAAQLSRKKEELDAMTERLTRLEEVEAAGAKAKMEVHARLERKS